MFSHTQINNLLVFDIESVSEYKSLDELHSKNPKMAQLWSKRCEFLRSSTKYGNENKTDEELYFDKAPLHPEFAKPIAVSLGVIRFDDKDKDSQITIHLFNLGNSEERKLLEETINTIKSAEEKRNKNGYKIQLAGHNIKRFDVPFLGKRILINGMKLPESLQVFGKKPWEVNQFDTSEFWSFGSFSE